MNAGPGGAMIQDEDENGQNRDWLDWLYMSMRGIMLMSIIYFYSSTSRFLLVAILGLIVYLYQAGVFNMRRPEQQQQQPGLFVYITTKSLCNLNKNAFYAFINYIYTKFYNNYVEVFISIF